MSVTEPESAIASSSGCGQTILTANTVGVTLTCYATNGAGLATSVPITVKIDQTPPVAIANSVPSPNSQHKRLEQYERHGVLRRERQPFGDRFVHGSDHLHQ